MKRFYPELTRRRFLTGTAATMAGASAVLSPFGARAAQFPDRNIAVVGPTRDGGNGSRVIRGFTKIWRKHLNNVKFELEFYPGASGQVGYQFYLQKKKPDCYSILLGAMGPEMIMYSVQKPDYKFPEDYAYFQRLDTEPMAIWVRADSPFKSLKQLIGEAKKRAVIMATSRMPHPATIGILLLADTTGAKFNIVPYGGGRKTVNALMTGEAEAIAIHVGNGTRMGDQVRFLGIFADQNPVPETTGNAPTVNQALGLSLPPLASSRALGIHRKAIQDYPDRFAILKKSAKDVMEDPEYAPMIQKIGISKKFINYGTEAECEAEAKNFMALAKQFENLLTAKKKK